MGDAYARARHHLAYAGSTFLDSVHAVVQVVDLPAAGQLLADGLGYDALVVLQHVGFHGLALKGRLLQCGHIPDAGQRHVQCAGDGRGRQREHIHADESLFQLLLVLDAEALLLVDDDQPQIMELYIVGQQPVGADNDVYCAVF